MSFKLDLHVHTESHGKTLINAGQLRQSFRNNNINGIAVANFFDISHALWLKKKLQEFIVIIGQEIWTNDGHVIGLGLKERIADFQDAADTIGLIHDQGGLAVAPHPFLSLGVGEKAKSLPLDAIEVYSGLIGVTVLFNHKAKRLAEMMNVAQVASTDTTDPGLIGRSHTEVFVEEPDRILVAIRAGRVKLYKRPLPLPIIFILMNILNFTDFDPCSLHAVSCFFCEKSMSTRLFKKKHRCIDCGSEQLSRISCCNGHFLCVGCVVRRGQLVAKAKEMSMAEGRK